jgi:4-hydroxy-tetrahydrodipicolinate reductase
MKIGIAGCTGRIGSILVKELQSGAHNGAKLAGGTVLTMDEAPKDADYFVTDSAEELFQRADAIIDFTSPEATANHATLAAKHGTILIAATSGLNAQQEAALKDAATKTPIIYAANTSVGVNMLLALVKQAAARLEGDNWDAEIIDIHHRFKVDAPSGTSYALADAIHDGRGGKGIVTHSREGHTGPREQGSIGFSVQRGGDDVIENTVVFFGNGERLELTHRATNRAIFAKGAIKAALWAKDKPAGLYAMADVLDIK